MAMDEAGPELPDVLRPQRKVRWSGSQRSVMRTVRGRGLPQHASNTAQKGLCVYQRSLRWMHSHDYRDLVVVLGRGPLATFVHMSTSESEPRTMRSAARGCVCEV
jgi:hypothetical protein